MFLSFIYYQLKDKQASDPGHLFGAVIFTEVLRLVFSRILTLVVALGLDIVISSISRYIGKIMVMTLLLTLAISASLAIEHTKHEHNINFAIVGVVNGIVQICDILLIFWIIMAFRRTLGYLGK